MMCHHHGMRDEDIKLRLDAVNSEIESRKIQLREIKLTYDIARDRLSRVDKQIKVLEEQYDLLSQGQLPLPFIDDEPVDL